MKRIQYLALSCLTLALSACGGGGSSSSSNPPPPTLSADQKIFEDAELNSGSSSVSFNMPFGGGNLVAGTNFIVAVSSGGFSQSPLTSGTQTETPVITSLDVNLTAPSFAPVRYLRSAAIVLRSQSASRQVSYSNGAIRTDELADDGKTVVTSSLFSQFSEIPLSGIVNNSPEELQANYPFDDWVGANNFSANAQWQSGAFYTRSHGSRIGDTYFVQDCANSIPVTNTFGTTPTPCQTGGTLDNFFPSVLYSGDGHPYEFDLASDGTISTVQGVRIWIANAPQSSDMSPTKTYRTYFELNGNVYAGSFEKDGTPYQYSQSDGTVVDYYISLNQAAINSIKQGVITGASAPGSQAGNSNEVSGTADLFGIGGHGINGALAPVDLQTHYGTPANLTGAGQTIVIVDAPGSGDPADDLNVYSQYYNLPQCNTANPCFQHIDLSNGAAVPTGNDWGTEVALDTQMVHAIAPAAKIILVTANSNSTNDLFSAVNYAASLPGVTAITMSFTMNGDMPSTYISEDSLLANYQANQGIVFFASAGDAGYNPLGAGYPAASPFVTGVGGTSINSVVWNSPTQSETAWQFSGGGNSPYATMPTWQSAYLGSALVNTNGGMRASPDVAAVADYQHSAVSIYYKQRWVMEGGTSASSPIWAGFSALFGQYLANEGKSLSALVKSTPGGFNGLLYQSKLTQGATAGFYDIVSGSNNLSTAPCNVCTAVVGYDNITGLGTPTINKLFANF